MGVHDLFWRCPECEAVGGVRRDGRRGRCVACGRVYRRGRGAEVIVEATGGEFAARTAAEWSDRQGVPTLEALRGAAPAGMLLRDAASLRHATGRSEVRRRGVYLGRIERFGEPSDGFLSLTSEEVRFEPTRGTPSAWPLPSIGAVVASSSSLQIRFEAGRLVSIRLVDASLRLWDETLHLLLQERWSREGKGEIVEFQPRLVTVPSA